MCEPHKGIVKDNITTTMNLIYSLSGVVKMCTQPDDQQDIVKKTAVEAARSIVLLASNLFEDVNRVYGEEHE